LLIYARNALRTTVRTPEELEDATGITVIGMIPNAPVRNERALLEYIIKKPASSVAEAVRNMRTAILLSNVDSTPQVIMLTSSVPAEGKTVMASALAQISAMSGKRVLLIDGDLRRHSLTKQFRIEGKAGLVALLSGNASFEQAVHHDDLTGVDILAADVSKVTAVDVFSSARYETFIDEMRKIYDFIIIDTPPVLAVPDARVIAQNADSVVYMVHWNNTTRRMIRTGLDLLHQVNVPVTGLTLTRIDPKRMDRYGYYGYGYGYGARDIEKYYTN
jgi:capsular exopolysaccharide synthesis family protein